MENNNDNFKLSDNDNKAKLAVTVEYNPEVPYLISESRVEQLEEIALQIEVYEKSEPKWDLVNNFRSFFATLWLTGACLIIPVQLEKTLVDPGLYTWIWIITISSMIGFCITQYVHFLQTKQHKDRYANESRKIKSILSKVRQSVVRKQQ